MKRGGLGRACSYRFQRRYKKNACVSFPRFVSFFSFDSEQNLHYGSFFFLEGRGRKLRLPLKADIVHVRSKSLAPSP